jgi:hypothetical protein
MDMQVNDGLHEHNPQPQKYLSLPNKFQKVHFTPDNYSSSKYDIYLPFIHVCYVDNYTFKVKNTKKFQFL